MRRALVLAALVALASAAPAPAALQPIRRTFGDLTIPRVRNRPVVVPSGHARGRVTVIVTLGPAPLAAARARVPAGRLARSKLDLAGASSRAYVARLVRLQHAAERSLRRAIPQATFGRAFQVILDGITVELPVTKLPTLAALRLVRTVYPSLRYTQSLDRSPSLIGATAFAAANGDRGQGIKIGVVDDGIDSGSRFFDPRGLQYPPGFPKGQTKFTTPKVIVARAYPGPGSGKRGLLPLDPDASFHGTHVAGIAAGDEGTTAPAGADHPRVTGLSGVAPGAWLGSYRVFDVPTPVGDTAYTPQIIAAFEDAVKDGMDVINFSGGGPEIDPRNDALLEAVANVAAAGVVPVVSAGNDRDDFGLGTVGTPGTAPAAITVGAVSNTHVFSPVLTVTGSTGLPPIPYQGERSAIPAAWATADRPLVDVGSITGTDGKPVDRLLCGPQRNLNAPASTLPKGSLKGALALVSRGVCTFTSKALRAKAAGAIGLVLVDNRPGEANEIPVELAIPGLMVADVDGARLVAAADAAGGRLSVRVGRDVQEVATGRGGTATSFTSAGVTAFTHDLKPDVSAPGGAILSSTLRQHAASGFAVFDGTSMAAPHVSGAAALLLQRHPTWTPEQLKSALMSTAGPAWADTAATREAPVWLEGAGLISVPAADDPRIFTEPTSLSFPDLDVTGGARSAALLLHVVDAGGGAGTWQVDNAAQQGTAGLALDLPPQLTIAPGGDAYLPIVARAAAGATPGDVYGFVLLRQGQATRRVPYFVSVTRPALEGVRPQPLARVEHGNTRRGANRVTAYRWPTAPFGPAGSYVGAPMAEVGAEQVFATSLARPAANIGVAVVSGPDGPSSDPFFLGALDENTVEGYTGTPVSVNAYLSDYKLDVGAAGVQFPHQGRYVVSVDAHRDEFTGAFLGGPYTLRSWVNDVTPPSATMLTLRVPAGRPTLAVRALDSQSGVDPYSLEVSYGGKSVGATAYDPATGIALFPLPASAPRLKVGETRATAAAGDLQETKNVDQAGQIENILPNTRFLHVRLQVVTGPTATWLAPQAGSCARGVVHLLAAGGSTAAVRRATFSDGGRRLATRRPAADGVYRLAWSARGARGVHTLSFAVTDRTGRTASAALRLRLCG